MKQLQLLEFKPVVINLLKYQYLRSRGSTRGQKVSKNHFEEIEMQRIENKTVTTAGI